MTDESKRPMGWGAIVAAGIRRRIATGEMVAIAAKPTARKPRKKPNKLGVLAQ